MQISKTILIGVFVICAAIIAILEYTFADSGSILYAMLFFVALAQGPLAIVAAADIVKSKWVEPYRREMLSVRHMMLFIAVLFAIFAFTGKIHLYDWSHHENAWLNQNFFIIRNIVLLLLSWVIAGKFAKESLNDSPGKSTWGVFWVLMFVINQTIVAFDWVMSLDYPWISTLFGAYFFVEAFYASLALAAVFTYFNYHNFVDNYTEKRFRKSQMDMMTMLFGFSIFWGYQFFSQYIVIWYGNIPEEVAYIKFRLDEYSFLLYVVIVILFLIPFLLLLSRKIKGDSKLVMPIGFLIWGGILLERYFMIAPHMNLHPLIVPVEVILTAIVFVVTVLYGRSTTANTYS
jgi:hypothetical protein